MEGDMKLGQLAPEQSVQLCIMVHGMGGTDADWDTWVDVLKNLYPHWILWPLQKMAAGCRFMSKDLRELSAMAATEVLEVIQEQRRDMSSNTKVVLHCIGHSMGGLIIRGALPRIVEEFDGSIELGHYLSLSSPHLGIQSSWLQPLHAWRNLCWLSWPFSKQLSQLAIQDCSSNPFLFEISKSEEEHMSVLGQFQERTCVSVAFGDPLIPVASGLIDPEVLLTSHSMVDMSFWHLRFDESFSEQMVGMEHKEATGWLKIPATMLAAMQLLLNIVFRILVAITSLGSLARTPISRINLMDKVSMSPKTPSSPASPSKSLSWAFSKDLKCKFPEEIYDGLVSVPWRRVVAHAHHRLIAKNMHVFLIGKHAEQFAHEHQMSRQCIEQLAKLLACNGHYLYESVEHQKTMSL
ncbi:DUF676 domain-containing protein [Durusdinium trenchii]|uniref:DUF676 domain-containing protein n=1 Tax=Durusdinium trenchii TaxID=1381693 RepID=A0ABP0KI15_9DINO